MTKKSIPTLAQMMSWGEETRLYRKAAPSLPPGWQPTPGNRPGGLTGYQKKVGERTGAVFNESPNGPTWIAQVYVGPRKFSEDFPPRRFYKLSDAFNYADQGLARAQKSSDLPQLAGVFKAIAGLDNSQALLVAAAVKASMPPLAWKRNQEGNLQTSGKLPSGEVMTLTMVYDKAAGNVVLKYSITGGPRPTHDTLGRARNAQEGLAKLEAKFRQVYQYAKSAPAVKLLGI